MVVNRNRKRTLCLFLTHNVLRELLKKLAGSRKILQNRNTAIGTIIVINICGNLKHMIQRVGFKTAQIKVSHHGLCGKRNALIADKNAIRTRDHGVNLIGRLSAERATDIFACRGDGSRLIGHSNLLCFLFVRGEARRNNLVYQAIGTSLFRRHPIVALGISVNALYGLTAVLGNDTFEAIAGFLHLGC